MNFLQAIILGIVQGITEFLPISSSAHLNIIPRLFGWGEFSLFFDVSLHFATLFAVVYIFRNDIYEILLSLKSTSTFKQNPYAKFIIIGTLPLPLIYLLVKQFENYAQSFNLLTIFMLIFFGILMIVSSYIKTIPNNNANLSLKNSVLIGLAQGVALINGVSRSGATILTGIFSGLSMDQAKRFSFLLGLPAILLAFISTTFDYLQTPDKAVFEPIPVVLVGMFSALITGVITIKFLLKYLSNHSLAIFGYYRILFAIFLYLKFFI